MPALADRVRETTTSTGTGAVTLAGAAVGFQSFAAGFAYGAEVYYTIAGGAQWEVGIGTSTSGVLSRDTVLSSSAAGARVTFAAGTKDVFCSYPAALAKNTLQTTFQLDDYGWIAPTVAVPKPDNTAALQAAIDAASAWAKANDADKAYFDVGYKAPVAWATRGFWDATWMTGAVSRRFESDWETPTVGQDVLVKDCSDAKLNGIWTINAGAWTRRADADTSAEFFMSQTNVQVLNGYLWKGSRWRLIGGFGTPTLGTTDLIWDGLPLYTRGVVTDDGLPIYTSAMIDVKEGVSLGLHGPLVALYGAAVMEHMVVFRTNSDTVAPLDIQGQYAHGGPLLAHRCTDLRATFAPVRVHYVGSRGTGARNPNAAPGASDCPLTAFSAHGFPYHFAGVWALYGDLSFRLWCSDMTGNFYGLAGGDGAWLRVGNSRFDLDIDSAGNQSLRIDQCNMLQGKWTVNAPGGTDSAVIAGGHLSNAAAPWAMNRRLTVDIQINSGAAYTRALDLDNVDNSRITLSAEDATFAVRWGAGVSNRVCVDADLTASTTPFSFASGVTTGGVMTYRQGGLVRTIEATSRFSANRGDANVTLAATEVPTQQFTTALTANRTVTLPTTGLYPGLAFTILRTGLGAFTLAVGALKTIPASTAARVDVEYTGSAFVLTNYAVL